MRAAGAYSNRFKSSLSGRKGVLEVAVVGIGVSSLVNVREGTFEDVEVLGWRVEGEVVLSSVLSTALMYVIDRVDSNLDCRTSFPWS